jgi:DNA-binding CsgD family transcriptional regulator
VGAPRARPPRAPAGRRGIAHPTEARVLELATDGLSNRQIAERMFVSPETIKTHFGHIFKKIDVHSRVEPVRAFPTASRD